MIRFGLRLAVASGRDALARLVIIAVAVMLGVGLLLSTLAGLNAVQAQWGRYAWMSPRPASTAAADPLWLSTREDYVDGRRIDRVDVAATGPHAPVPPGIPSLPAPGEYYASPAMAKLIASTPADQLGDRFPARSAGTIGDAALPSPDALMVIVGDRPDQLAQLPGAVRVTSLASTGSAIPLAALDLILSVIGAGLLFPVLIFIGTATRLAATRREQRFAAMRLVGATPRQVSTVAAVEATVAAAIGTAAGFGLFYLLRRPIAALPFTGQSFFPADLSLGRVAILAVALGVPVAAAIAARVALRRVRISPLGVARQVTPRPPRAYRLIPLLVGAGELAAVSGHVPSTSNGQVAVFLPGILLMMVGLILAGPWLTMVGARALARRASRPAPLMAARRLADNPHAAFRAVSGVILALFVTSVATGVISTIVANRGPQSSALGKSDLTLYLVDQHTTAVPDGMLADLAALPGVRGAVVVRVNPAAGRDGTPVGLVSCTDLNRLSAAYGRCPAGAAVAEVWQGLRDGNTGTAPSVWPAATVAPDALAELTIDSVVVDTDGSTPAINRARTVMETAYPDFRVAPATDNDIAGNMTTQLSEWRQLANVVILVSLPIAGCGLAVSVAGGLSDRRRPFSLLRLTGASLRTLGRVVALESAVPLLAAAAVAVAGGFGAAELFLRAQMGYALLPPGIGYYLTVLAGIAVCFAVIATTLPLLRRITGPETARTE